MEGLASGGPEAKAEMTFRGWARYHSCYQAAELVYESA
jgi:hypothetical protein